MMHTCCLGIVQYLNGNCVWEMFEAMGGTMTRHVATCGKLTGLIKMFAKKAGVENPVSNLTIGMVRSADGKPKLKLKARGGGKNACTQLMALSPGMLLARFCVFLRLQRAGASSSFYVPCWSLASPARANMIN